MLVLLGPSFAGGDAEYQRLSKVTGMVAYDLRARLKPGMWGLVKALADEVEATRLAAALKAEGFPIVVMAREVAGDPERPIVWLKGLSIDGQQLTLRLSERSMTVAAGALCSIVRGEAQVGKGSPGRLGIAGSATSSSTFGPWSPNADDLQCSRIGVASQFRGVRGGRPALSLRHLDRAHRRALLRLKSCASGPAARPVLSIPGDRLALLGRVRVDRSARASSISSFAQKALGRRPAFGAAAASASHRSKEIAGDDGSIRITLIGQAERLLAAQQAGPKA